MEKKFRAYQQYVAAKCLKDSLGIETNASEILALSYILLLKPNQYSEEILLFFILEELELIRHCILKALYHSEQYENVRFDENLLQEINQIIKVNIFFD